MKGPMEKKKNNQWERAPRKKLKGNVQKYVVCKSSPRIKFKIRKTLSLETLCAQTMACGMREDTATRAPAVLGKVGELRWHFQK